MFSCEEKGPKIPEKSPAQIKADSLRNDSLLRIKMMKELDTFPKIHYQQVLIKDNAHRAKLIKEFAYISSSPAKNKSFLTLNRKELRFLHVGDTAIIPDKYYENMIAYSLFPQYYHGAKDLKKLIMVSTKWQCYGCYEYGKLTRFAAINSGKEKTPSYPGRYALVWKQLERKSSLDETWIMPFTFNFHRYAGSAFHQFDMPGYPASHSCIRQFGDDAKWLYYWGKGAKYDSNRVPIPFSGTPVVILDVYDFANYKYKIWRKLTSNKDVIIDLPPNPMTVEEALIPIMQIPKEVRGILPNRKKYLYAEDSLRARGIIRKDVQLIYSVNFNVLRKEKEAKKKKDSVKKAALPALNDSLKK